ncbi:hypothetical protein CBR_g12549 [Chara braunii]|uniref:CCHC-type domain-containing protein n=1 Tax=Chara braunii TaxID=69332 RepID=A0A388JSP5_CHABU|nr:hypothetical protein CBR_g12549 [Chara braunii]|eukprot:GBG60811.1 hypothetical protein CBR_g12549 [Chara braunii]
MAGHEQQEFQRREDKDRRNERGREDRGMRRGPTCFNSREEGHYANQCPHPRRARYSERPSSSTDSRRGRSASPTRYDRPYQRRSNSQDPEVTSKIQELGRNLEAVTEFVKNQRAIKEEKKRRKNERAEAKMRAEEEKREKERKAAKKTEKARCEELRLAKIDKSVDLKVSIKISELCEKLEAKFILAPPSGRKDKGKQKATSESSGGSSFEIESSGSGTDQKSDFLTPRLTKSKRKIKTRLSLIVEKMKTPVAGGTVAKLRYRNQVMEEIKGLDATKLQTICKEEGIWYAGKIDAIFDIASHCTRLNFDEVTHRKEEVIKITEEVEDDTTVDEPEDEGEA